MPFGLNGSMAYKSVAAHGGVAAADPHGLGLMLLDGAISRIAQARACHEDGQRLDATLHMQRELAIVGEFKAALDLSQGEIAHNLDALYDYICRQLPLAHVPSKRDGLSALSALLGEIRSAWAAIPPTVNGRGGQMPAGQSRS